VAVNPLAASRYRERHAVSRAKSDPGDAKVLADLVRTDRHNHRPVAGDKTVSRWAKEGRLPFLKTVDGHRRYPAAEIRQLADELQVQPTV
jgi:hypothetical protein